MIARTVSVGVFIRRDGLFLMNKRGPLCSRGYDCWSLLGGMVNDGESLAAAAKREIREEAGIEITIPPAYAKPTMPSIRCVPGLLGVTELLEENRLHFWVIAEYAAGIPQIHEPDKSVKLDWLSPRAIGQIPGGMDPSSEQYYWTPIPLWQELFRPYWISFR